MGCQSSSLRPSGPRLGVEPDSPCVLSSACSSLILGHLLTTCHPKMYPAPSSHLPVSPPPFPWLMSPLLGADLPPAHTLWVPAVARAWLLSDPSCVLIPAACLHGCPRMPSPRVLLFLPQPLLFLLLTGQYLGHFWSHCQKGSSQFPASCPQFQYQVPSRPLCSQLPVHIWLGKVSRVMGIRGKAGEADVSGETAVLGRGVFESCNWKCPKPLPPALPCSVKGLWPRRQGATCAKVTRLGFEPDLGMALAFLPGASGAEAVVCLQVRCSTCGGAKHKARQPRRCQMCSGSGRRR